MIKLRKGHSGMLHFDLGFLLNGKVEEVGDLFEEMTKKAILHF